MKPKLMIPLAVVGVAILVTIAMAGLAFGTVDEGEVHVETNWGEYTGVTYDSGSYWLGASSGPLGVMPNGISYSTDSLTTEAQTMELEVTDGLSQDGQDIDATVSVTYSLDGQQAGSFYSDSDQSEPFRTVGMWEERIGERAVESAVQDATASVSTQEMVEAAEDSEAEGANMGTLRAQILGEVEQQLEEETDANSPEIEIQSVRIEKVTLSAELSQSLESIATENAEAERRLIEAEAEAEAERAIAEGQADAFDIIVEAYGSEEAALQAEWIEAINEDEGTIIIDAEAAPILDLNERDDVETGDDRYED